MTARWPIHPWRVDPRAGGARMPDVSARRSYALPPGGGTQGFTLLDALVALAILSLIMTAVPRGLAGARHLQERSKDGLEASLAAQEVLEGRLAGRNLRPGVYGGEISGRRWQAVLTPHPGVPAADRSGDERRHRLLDAHLTVAMSGSALELRTVVVGTAP